MVRGKENASSHGMVTVVGKQVDYVTSSFFSTVQQLSYLMPKDSWLFLSQRSRFS